MNNDVLKSRVGKDGKRMIDKYLILNSLGKGQFGEVFKAINTETNEFYAVKQVEISTIKRNLLLKRLLNTEIQIMKEIDHPNVLHLYEVLMTKNSYYLVIKYCNQGDFHNYLDGKGVKYFQEKDAAVFLTQLMNGFYELRKRKILHRDLKLDNILMHNDNLIIGDFGLAKIGAEINQTKVGSPYTQAPELLFSSGNNVVYNSKSDLWSMGVVFYQILCGSTPYMADTVEDLKIALLNNSDKNLKFPPHINLSVEAKDLIRKLLTIDSRNRLDWAGFFDHPFFTVNKQVDQKQQVHVFGNQFLQSMQSAVIQFQANQIDARKKHEEPEETIFLAPEQLEVQDMQAKTVDEQENYLGDVAQQILEEQINKQIYYRYSQELNVVYFLIYAEKNLQAIIKENSFQSSRQVLFTLSQLILKKAQMLNHTLFAALGEKRNYLNVNGLFFISFCLTEHYQKLIQLSGDNQTALSKHLELLKRRAAKNRLAWNHEALMRTASGEFDEIDRAIKHEIESCYALNLSKGLRPNDAAMRSYYLLRLLADFSLNTGTVFAEKKVEGHYQKFNWSSLYYMLQKGSSQDLEKHIDSYARK